VALADGVVDELERVAMLEALRTRKIFSGSELDLVVDLALAQARSWQGAGENQVDLEDLQKAAEAVAMADSVVTDEERAVIRQLLTR
jgi:tellurite resistance protein